MKERTTRVLVAEDEPGVQRLLGEILARMGCQVQPVFSGSDALEVVRISPPDVVFLDFMMPGPDGLETLRDIKAIAPQLPVIIVSAIGKQEKLDAAMDLGAYRVVKKPFDVEVIRGLITELRGNREGF